jgi:hypothetical protein
MVRDMNLHRPLAQAFEELCAHAHMC